MGNIAFLVLCAVAPKNAGRMCSHFTDSRFSFFLHCDLKIDLDRYLDHMGPTENNVFVIPKRCAVFWAGFSMIEATIELMRAAVFSGDFRHFVLLSDDSFSLFSPDDLYKRINEASAPWIETWPVPTNHEFQERYRQFFYLDSFFSNPRWAPTEKRAVTQDDLDALARLDLRRRAGKVPLSQLYAGKQWWILQRQHLIRMLDFHEKQIDFQDSFRYSAVTDEIYLQTMFRQIYPSDVVAGNPMYDDFSSFPKPLVFTRPEDLIQARRSPRLFVRKVGENAEAYVDAIVETWR